MVEYDWEGREYKLEEEGPLTPYEPDPGEIQEGWASRGKVIARKAAKKAWALPGQLEELGERGAGQTFRAARRIIVGPEIITYDEEGNVIAREPKRKPWVGKTLTAGLAPLGKIDIQRGPAEKGLRELIEGKGKRPFHGEDEEVDILEESLDFEPFGPATDVGADMGGVDALSDPFAGSRTASDLFTGAADFSGNVLGLGILDSGSPSRVAEVRPVNLRVPGGLTVSHILQDSTGRIGYRLVWQGEAVDWFPPEGK